MVNRLADRLSPTIESRISAGLKYQKQGQLEEAVLCYRGAIELAPDFALLHSNLGNVLQELQRFDQAQECYIAALELEPHQPILHNNLGTVLHNLGRYDIAIENFATATSLKVDYSEAWSNMGNAQKDSGLYNEAEASYQKAIACNSNNAEAHHNLGLLYLLRGDFQVGWTEYSWRWQTANYPTPLRSYNISRWNGESLEGRHILIYPEQGLGDLVQFARYVPILHKAGARVSLEVPTALHRLMQGLQGVENLVMHGDSPPVFDTHCPLMELPRLSKTVQETIPSEACYLQADPDLIDYWTNRLGSHDGFRVGIVWAGNPNHKKDRERSINARLFQPLATLPGVHLFSLQQERDNEAISLISPNTEDLAPLLFDFAETAAAMRSMDLIITVDTAVAHVAGAMGLPVWTLLPFVPDWRWLLNRNDSPWYPSMRLFRQETPGDWESVMNRVMQALHKLV